MDSVPKRHCRRHEPLIEEKTLVANENKDEDLISNLPDCVLSHILSKLPTKYAVATAVLSTRWKDLFALIPKPNLDFDDSLILHAENKGRSNLEKRVASFAKFTYRVLDVMLKEVPFIFQFNLKCFEKYEDEQILDWVYAALKRAVPILDIDICMDCPRLFFELISGLTSLLYLALRNNLDIYMSNSFSLPNLEYLFLDGIQFYNSKQISLLLSGCPVLKSLTMRYCHLEEVDEEIYGVNISIPSLTHLSIEYCWYTGAVDYYQVVLDTPALEELYYKDYVPDELVLKNLNSIKDAHISVRPMEGLDEANSLQYNKDVAALVRACSNVNSLFLSQDTLSALQKSSEPVPRFCNLTDLQLGGFDMDGLKWLPQLIENVPKLEVLSISKEFLDSFCQYEFYEEK